MKTLIKSFLNPSSSFYKILSYFINYKRRSYLPKKINGIDLILEHLALEGSQITFVQVGSNDGKSGDPIFKFIHKYDWRGVLIEPIPFLYEKLKSNYQEKRDNLHFLNIAISAGDEKFKKFYVIDEKYRDILSDWHYQLGSFYREMLFHHGIANVENYITSINVPVNTIQNIIDNYLYNYSLDLVHIDAEGYDLEILKTVDFSKSLPKIFITEFANLDITSRKKMISILRNNNYRVYCHEQDFISLHATVHAKYIKGTLIYPFWA